MMEIYKKAWYSIYKTNIASKAAAGGGMQNKFILRYVVKDLFKNATQFVPAVLYLF